MPTNDRGPAFPPPEEPSWRDHVPGLIAFVAIVLIASGIGLAITTAMGDK